MQPDQSSKASTLLIAAAGLSCVVQLFWFARRCFNQIDYDGMAYVGIARHLRQGEYYAAINAFRSPLLSWLIAAASFGSANGSAGGTSHYLHVGKLINVGAFLVSAALLYIFAEKLWHSRLAASLAVFLFTLGRGLIASTVTMITPDFLFAALVLVYFVVLLRCLNDDRLKDWFSLGSIHGLAFLAKAFAMPWLALCTLLALVASGKPWRTRAVRLAVAALIPILVAVGWATVLHSKYGVYTTGTQFKSNLLQWTLQAYSQHPDTTYTLLRDTTKEVDDYVVDDPMPPGSWPWNYPVRMRQVLPKIFLAEQRNIPRVLKELMIVATPGGFIAFVATLAIVTRRRRQYPEEWRLAVVVAASALSLILAYSMLVFDARYLFPLIPLVLAIAARFLIPDSEFNHDGWRKFCIALVVLGVVTSMVYPSSPFRRLTRDFQASCYDAGKLLRAHAGSRVVSIGSGPYPEHGVGWEAGYKASFFGEWKIIAAIDSLPNSTQWNSLSMDIEKASPDAILAWGSPQEAGYTNLIHRLSLQFPHNSCKKIVDPDLGEVGAVLFTTH